MIFGIMDNKGKMKKGVPLLISILGITSALSVWGVSAVWANTKDTHVSLKGSIEQLQKRDTEILRDIGNQVTGIHTVLAQTGINPDMLNTLVTTMKDANREIVAAQINGQSQVFDEKLKQAQDSTERFIQKSAEETALIKDQQEELQDKADEVISRFDSSITEQKLQALQLEDLARQVKEFNSKQQQINIRNAQQVAESFNKMDEVLKALDLISRKLEKP